MRAECGRSAGAGLGLDGPHQFAGERAAVRLRSAAEALGGLRRMAARTLIVGGSKRRHPDIKNEAISEARGWKQDYADRNGIELSLATQFCFRAQPERSAGPP